MEVDKSLTVLIGNSVCASMVVAYAGRLRQNERKMAFEKWRKICDSFKIQVHTFNCLLVLRLVKKCINVVFIEMNFFSHELV